MKYLLPLLVTILFSCKETSSDSLNETTTVNTPIKDTIQEQFEYKLKNKPKIFLSFWDGMTSQEYSKVYNILNSEGVIQNEQYKVNNCNLDIKPKLENDKLVGVQLTGNIECIYPLYQKKYGVPDLIKRSSIASQFIENNPNYSPVYSYYNGSDYVRLPSCFVDKSLPLEGVYSKPIQDTSSALTDSYLPTKQIVVNAGNSIIKFEQEISLSDLTFYRYSLEDSKEMQQYQMSEEGRKHFNTFNVKESQRKYLEINSKTRIGTRTKHPRISITYLSMSRYDKELKEQQDREDINSKHNIQKVREKEQLEQKALNEI